jgi:uncharacterized membrane protein YfcA
MKTMISSTRRPHAIRTVYNHRHIDFAAGIIIGGLIAVSAGVGTYFKNADMQPDDIVGLLAVLLCLLVVSVVLSDQPKPR